METPALAVNRKANHEYFILDTWLAGIILEGTEVKSIRNRQANIADAYCQFSSEGELWLLGAHISPWQQAGSKNNHEPTRHRKLLLKNKELKKLFGMVSIQGHTIVPLRLFVQNNRIKILIGLAKGKQQHDKRQTIKERDNQRQLRNIKNGDLS
jgi:SsrA-binding protein